MSCGCSLIHNAPAKEPVPLEELGLPVVDYPEYNEEDAQKCIARFPDADPDIALRCYTSNLIGSQASLVLHGGGNTSVKTMATNRLGEQVRVLGVKGSGYNLDSIVPKGFPQMELDHLEKMAKLEGLDDGAMLQEFRSKLIDANSPNPSLETLLHSIIPQKFVDHSHADAIAALADHDMETAQRLFSEAFGNEIRFAIVPYLRPGFGLTGACQKVLDANPDIEALVLLKHGLFTWADSAKTSYENHIKAVHLAEVYISKCSLPALTLRPLVEPSPAFQEKVLCALRGVFSKRSNGTSWIVRRSANKKAATFAQSNECETMSQIGTITPDHVIRTKPKPLVLRGLEQDKFYTAEESNVLDRMETKEGDAKLRGFIEEQVDAYGDRYHNYFQQFNEDCAEPKEELDRLPRVLLVEHFGLITVDKSFKACMCTADIYGHTVPAIMSSIASGGKFEPVTPEELWNIEYWELEQRKLKVGAAKGSKSLAGKVAYITGGASGIGLATAKMMASQGASLAIVDMNKERVDNAKAELKASGCDGIIGLVVDVSDVAQVEDSFQQVVAKFGGVDIVVSNAGIVVQASPGMASCPNESLEKSMQVNFFGHQYVAAAGARRMVTQDTGGSLLFNVSKAPLNPGPKLGPYCIAKAATLALMRQYAVEYGEHKISSNAVNADRVRTNLFDLSLVEKRAAARGLTADEYFRSNLLKAEVVAEDVAQAFMDLVKAKKTTGGIYTVDGGNIAAAPR